MVGLGQKGGRADSARRVLPWALGSVGLHALLLWPGARELPPLPPPGSFLQARLLAPDPVPVPVAAPVPAPPARSAARPPPPPPAPATPQTQPVALQFPPAGEFSYALRWQGDAGEARLQFEQAGERYRLTLHRGTASRRLPAWVSEGRVGAAGLQPERFQAGRRASTPPPGAQDRLSWIWQAAALARAHQLQPGQRLRLAVQNWRGEVQDWTLLAENDADQPGWLRLRRELPEGALLEQLLWLDPAQAHRPVRLRVRFDQQERWELGGPESDRDISPTPPQGL